MDVRILLVPYDSGHRAVRMGRGPLHLIEYGLEDALRAAGHEPEVVMIDSELDPPTEVAVAFELARSLAVRVREAVEAGAFPLVLAGNCASALGTVPGLGAEDTDVLWFDAHADVNTPETTTSGFLDGMAVAALTGRCWTRLAGSIPGFVPLPDRRITYVGIRDLDGAEDELLHRTELGRITAAEARAAENDDALDGLRGAGGLYLHVDLDVLDPSVARANAFASADGLTVEEVVTVAGWAGRRAPIRGASITAFDPAFDDHGRDSAAATAIILGVLAAAAASSDRG